MSKHKKRKPPSSALQQGSGLDMAGWWARIEALIAAGQTRVAVETAKQCGKERPGPEADALVVMAYKARIQALIASGMAKRKRFVLSFSLLMSG